MWSIEMEPWAKFVPKTSFIEAVWFQNNGKHVYNFQED